MYQEAPFGVVDEQAGGTLNMNKILFFFSKPANT